MPKHRPDLSGASGTTAVPATDPVAALGRRIRHTRTLHGLTLKSVAGAVGCSESMLSKIECGLASPSLTMLHRIAQALQTNVAELTTLAEPAFGPVLRPAQRPVVELVAGARREAGIRLERLIPPQRGQLLQGDIHILEPGAQTSASIHHQGEELGFVLEGQLQLTLGDDTHELQAGDSFYFSSDRPHRYRNPGTTVTRVIWVNTPPTF